MSGCYTAPAKWRVELRAKIGQYRNRCFYGDWPSCTIKWTLQLVVLAGSLTWLLFSIWIDNDPRKRGKHTANFDYFVQRFHKKFSVSLAFMTGSDSQPADTDSPSHLVSLLISRSPWRSIMLLVSVPHWHCIRSLVFYNGSYKKYNMYKN